jgi:hypothetical protein
VWLSVPAALLLVRRPLLAGLVIAAGGTVIRLIHARLLETSDQLAVSRAALEHVLAGGNPYGVGFDVSWPVPGSPFVYGPLGLLTAPGGVPLEALAAGGTLVLLALTRSYITLAIYAAQYFVVQFSTTGINDLLPAFLIHAGLVALLRWPLAGAGFLALAAGVKPYAFAWFPAVIGYGGPAVAAVLLAVAGIVWSPLLLWGPGSFLRSVEMAAAVHPEPENALNVPALRILAVPVAILTLFARRWSLVVLGGTAVFSIVLFLDRWASLGYWLVILPLLGMLAERLVRQAAQAAVRASTARAAGATAAS